MKIKVIFFILSFTCIALYVSGQDTLWFKFKAKESPMESQDTSLYLGKSLEYTIARIYLSKDIFIERNLFSGRDNWSVGDADTFKISKGTWYIKEDGEWRYFFSNKGFKE